MPVKTATTKSRAVNLSTPAKAGGGRAIQRKTQSSPLPAAVQRKEQPGGWAHRRPQKAVGGRSLIQPKVNIHAANDHFEKEADHVADKATGNQPASSGTRITSIKSGTQSKGAECQSKSIQSKINNLGSPDVLHSGDASPPAPDIHTTHPLTAVLSNQSTRGSPLPAPARRQMENRIGANFENVRIHTGQESHDASASIGARAFTQGANIHFANGQFNPNTRSGQHLLAHELTHTVQQGASPATTSTVSSIQRSTESHAAFNPVALPSEARGPPLQTKCGDTTIQCSFVDTAISRIGDLLDDLPSITEGIEGAKRWLMGKARRFAGFIPGYSALGVVMGQDPITGERIEQNGRNFINAALDIIPGGSLLKQKLEELGAIDRAAAWIDQQIQTLSGIVSNIRSDFTTTWNALGLTSILDGPLNVLRNLGGIFERAITSIVSFAERAASELLSIVKEFLLTQIVDFIKTRTNAYELLKVIIGHDPVTGENVAANGTTILNALLELGGEQGREQRRQMQDTGSFQKAADWIDRGIAVFGNLYQTIRDNFGLIWNAVSIDSLMHPIDTFNRLYEKFAEPVRQVLNFVGETLVVILGFIKEALLGRLSAWARTVRGYALVTVLIGKDPFTNVTVPRSVPNIVRGFMSLMEGGEEQYRQMEESGAIARTTARINAAVARLNMTPATILQLFIDLWNSFSFSDLTSPVQAFHRIIDRFGEPIARLIAFIVEIVKIVIEVLLQVMNFPTDLINNIITRAMAAFERIKRDPVAFLRNLLRAIKQGFIQFFDHIGTHLMNGLVGWLMSELRDANIPPLTDFSLRGVIGWVLQVLGISMEAIWAKLAAHPRVGPERVARLRNMINTLEGIWTFIRDVQERGMGAIWDKIQEQLSNLWNTVLDAVKNWIMERIISQVTARLLSMLDPTGIMAVINSAIAIYHAVQSFIRYLRQILEVINSFVNGVADIAEGNVSTAANYLERTMDRAMPIVIGFLANQVGLSGIGRRIGEMITRVREMVDRALTWLVNRAVNTGMNILDRVMAAGRSAVRAVLGWLGIRKEFRANNGESHELYFEGANEQTSHLWVASREPMRYAAFLDRINTVASGGNQTIVAQKQAARAKLDEIETAKNRPLDSSVPEEQARSAKFDIVNAKVIELSVLTAPLFGGPALPLVFNYGGLNAEGFATGMTIRNLNKNNRPPVGSSPGVSNAAYEKLDHRRRRNGSYYIKGHLLNGYLGGTGLDFRNLTPLSRAGNGNHERDVERKVIEKIDQGKTVEYIVTPVYGSRSFPTDVQITSSTLDTQQRARLGDVISAENLVPLGLECVANVLNEASGQYDTSIVHETVVNPVESTVSSYEIQPKLKNAASTTHHEKEADRVAHKAVSRERSAPVAISKITPAARPSTAQVAMAAASPPARASPLPVDTRRQMEKHIGADFSNVRIHTGEASQKANAAIGSRAFTQGANIHFAQGEFNPGTKSGKQLLAHELTHTVQQGAAHQNTTGTAETGKKVSHVQATKKDAVVSAAKPVAGHGVAAPADAVKVPAGKAAKKKSPSSPEEDPAFQRTVGKAHARANEQRAHAPPAAKAADAQSAAGPVPFEAQSKAQNRKAESIEAAGKEEKLFDAASFKKDLLARITEVTPKTLEEADDFKEHNKIGEVKTEVGQKVSAEKENTTGPMTHATADPLHVNESENKQPVTLPPTNAGSSPASIGAKNAAPKAKTDDEVSMQEQSASLDDEMKQNNVTETQLQGSNEPTFQSAVKEKRNAQKDALEKPVQYRKDEKAELKTAESEAASKAAGSLAGMHKDRDKNFAAVILQQNDSKKKDEDARAKVAKDINDKYAATEKTVNDLLTQAETLSGSIFDQGAEDARKIFEDYTDRKMRAYKNDRYSGLLGGGYWLKDKFMDLPDEVNVFYADGKQLYLDKMDQVITDVSNVVTDKLNGAKKAIDDGKKDIDTYVAALPDNLKEVGTEAVDNIKDKFDSLEQGVKDKGHQLIDELAKKYVDNVKKLDDRINELKEANKGLISKAIGLLKEVWKVIKNIYQLFKTILQKLAQVVGIIIGEPGKFFSNLGAAFSKGFDRFKSRLGEHLENGLMAWLSSQLGVPDLKLPDKFDIASIFGMVLQVMGINYAHIRERAVLQIGEERVALMETTVGIFQRVYKEGLGAIWEIIKEKFTDFKDMIWEAIKSFIKDAVIKAALVFLLSLLNPIAAFVKACMAIYDFLMMLVRLKDRIIELLNSILDAVLTIATGNVDAAAAAIEMAFAKSIPIIIGFLAALLHLNDIGAKVRDIILRIRAKVDKLIDWLITKAYAFVGPAVELAMSLKNKGKALLDKGKEKVVALGKSAVSKVAGWLGIKKSFTADNGETHELYFKGSSDESSELWVASRDPMRYDEFLDNIKKVRPDGDKKIMDKKAEAKKQLEEVEKAKNIPIVSSITEEKDRAAKYDKVNAEVIKLSAITAHLFGGPLEPLEFNFGGLTDVGFATKMTIRYLNKNNRPPVGGPPGVSNDDYRKLNLRRNGDKPYYVKGHLLNGFLGGTGKDFRNLTPLSISGNGVHEASIESKVIEKVDEGKTVEYIVEPDYSSPLKTPSSAEIQKSNLSAAKKAKMEDIVSAEKKVPTAMKCEANILNEKKGKFDTSIVNTPVPNKVETDLKSYEL
ncbi:eCIS core domain-containing protein [Mucilaginibacter sp.]|jgi:hypothetical protein|uniref:eCIS core domain-containing protein n=1 Tax=Mucilaginibacter sp. TaxID=1882438 RepID=UPI002BC4F587|nr:DUF4157 domain-containing protein [Mucilaginibacter sp.]HTI61070.1 DUF4157 domain-containing protein [Mucilaginibacter sp.]